MNRQLKILLDAIERKHKLSIREFEKSDLYCGMSFDEINQWYANLLSIVIQHPPEKPVEAILIFERKSIITQVKYRYSTSQSSPTDPCFEMYLFEEI